MRLRTISETEMPDARSARSASIVSSIASASGTVTQCTTQADESRSRFCGDPCVIFQLSDESIGQVRPADSSEPFTDDAVVGLQCIEDANDCADRCRRIEETQRVTGRGGVDDDAVVTAGSFGETNDLEQRHQLVDAWNRELEDGGDVFPIEPGAVLQHVGQGTAMVAQPAREGARGVELDGLQVTAGDWNGGNARRQPVFSASPSECAGSVDTSQHPPPGPRGSRGEAAAQVVLPTPPLPPKKMKASPQRASSW